jgi:hypothetical protein
VARERPTASDVKHMHAHSHRSVASRARALALGGSSPPTEADAPAYRQRRAHGARLDPPLDRAAFLDGTAPVLAAFVGEGVADRAPMLVLVVEDRADIELMAAIAQGSGARSRMFAGAWSALIDGYGDIARFHLIELIGDLERCWTLPDWASEQLAVAQREHLVALLPRELAGNGSSDMIAAALASALIVRVEPSEAVSGLPERR